MISTITVRYSLFSLLSSSSWCSLSLLCSLMFLVKISDVTDCQLFWNEIARCQPCGWCCRPPHHLLGLEFPNGEKLGSVVGTCEYVWKKPCEYCPRLEDITLFSMSFPEQCSCICIDVVMSSCAATGSKSGQRSQPPTFGQARSPFLIAMSFFEPRLAPLPETFFGKGEDTSPMRSRDTEQFVQGTIPKSFDCFKSLKNNIWDLSPKYQMASNCPCSWKKTPCSHCWEVCAAPQRQLCRIHSPQTVGRLTANLGS